MTEQTGGYEASGPPSQGQTTHEPALRHYVGVVRRRIWAVITAFVIVVTLGTINAYKATPIYEAVAKILVEAQSNPVVSDSNAQVQWFVDEAAFLDTQKALVTTRAVLEKAIGKPELQSPAPTASRTEGGAWSLTGAWEKARGEVGRTASALLGVTPTVDRVPEPWEGLRGAVTVEAAPPFLLVKAQDTDPNQAAKVVNAVAKAFEEYSLERKLKNGSIAFEFLRGQRTKQELDLTKAESDLQQFREQSEMVSLDVEEKDNPVLVRHRRLSEQLTDAQVQRIGLDAQVAVLKEAVNTGGQALSSGNQRLFAIPAVRSDGPVNALRTQLMDTEREIATLANTQGPENTQLQAAQIKLKLTQEKLQESLSQLIDSLTAQLNILSKQEQELKRQYEEQNRLALDLAKQSYKWDRLKSDVGRQRKLFDVLVDRIREVNITSDFSNKTSNVDVVEPAMVPSAPVAPNKPRMVWMSIFLGLFAGIGLAFFFEYLDDTIKTPDDLEQRVGVPVLGFVPAITGRNGQMDSFAYKGRVSVIEPKSSITEAYRNIRTSLFFSAPPEESKVLVLTSSAPRDGKTTTSTNLALVIAQSGKRILLVDADFRRPMIHKIFGLDTTRGLSSILVGQSNLEEAVQKVKHDGRLLENLDVLVAGPKPPNPAELLDSEAMRTFLAEARKKYDRVIIDTPPVLFVADATIVSAMCDGVILVVKAAKNSRSVAIKAREHILAVKGRILGGILNDVRIARFGYYYSYYYYYYPYSRYYYDYYHSYYSSEEEDGKGKKGAESKS